MNILFTSSGRRTYLIEFFRHASNKHIDKIYAANNDEESPAIYFADEYFITPSIKDKDYITYLLNLCKKEKIDLVVPLFDLDVVKLSEFKSEFNNNGTQIMVVDYDIANLCHDKYKLQLFLSKNGFNFIPGATCNSYIDLIGNNLKYPLIIKPRSGMGSIGVEIAENAFELEIALKRCEKIIKNSYLQDSLNEFSNNFILIQNQIKGSEYGLDIINNLKGEYQTTIVKKKHEMRFGETQKATVISNKLLQTLGARISNFTKHPGIIDVDVIVDENQKAFIIDINARFGGGYPFSHIAGVDLPKAIFSWLQDANIDMKNCLIPKFGSKGVKIINAFKLPM